MCYTHRVSAAMMPPRPPDFYRSSIPTCRPPSLLFHSLYTLPSSVASNSFACHSYENCRGVGVFFPNWNSPLTTNHSPLARSLSPLSATLTTTPISVHSKELIGKLSPLDATLTKNRGVPPSSQNLSSPINTRLPDSIPVPRTCIHRTIGAGDSLRHSHCGPRFCVLLGFQGLYLQTLS
jgi:hypothetical protein